MSRFTSSRQRTNWLEFTLWLLTFLLVYLLPPATGEVSEGAGVLAPLLPVATAWTYRLAGLLVLAGFSAFAIYIGEYFLLIERVERPLLVLFIVALFTTTPSMGILSAGALIFQLLILLLSFGTYQDTHQPRVSLFIGLLVGVLLLVPVIIWGQYHLRSIAWRPIIALLIGVILPLWLFVPVLLLMGNGALQAYGAFALRAFPLPMPQELKSFEAVPLASYAVVLVTFFVGYLLYRRRYYRVCGTVTSSRRCSSIRSSSFSLCPSWLANRLHSSSSPCYPSPSSSHEGWVCSRSVWRSSCAPSFSSYSSASISMRWGSLSSFAG